MKHITEGVEKVNAVNYLTKPPPPADEFYYEEDSYALNDQTRGFRPNAQVSIRRIGANIKEIKVETMGITTKRWKLQLRQQLQSG